MSELWKWLGAKDRCWRCGEQVGDRRERKAFREHHIIPKSEGGSDMPDNMALLCSNCWNYIHTAKMKSVGYTGVRASRSRSSWGRPFAQQFYQTHAGHPPTQCPKCRSIGRVVEVAEFPKRISITLACPNCGHRFAAEFR